MDGDGAGAIGAGDLGRVEEGEGGIGGELGGGISGRSMGRRGGWGAECAARTAGGEGNIFGKIG